MGLQRSDTTECLHMHVLPIYSRIYTHIFMYIYPYTHVLPIYSVSDHPVVFLFGHSFTVGHFRLLLIFNVINIKSNTKMSIMIYKILSAYIILLRLE